MTRRAATRRADAFGDPHMTRTRRSTPSARPLDDRLAVLANAADGWTISSVPRGKR